MDDPCIQAIAWTVLLAGGLFLAGYVWGYIHALSNHTKIFQRPGA